MKKCNSLSSLQRTLMSILTFAFGLIGLVLFFASPFSADNFAWKISPMVAMTIGGWYLGTAVVAGIIVYYKSWNVIYPSMLYIGVFSVSEGAVLLINSSKLKLNGLLSWSYIGMLVFAIITSLLVLYDWWQQKPILVNEGKPEAAWKRWVNIAFVIIVFFLSGVAISGHWIGQNGQIFPEPLSQFTLQSFGAFYFSLAFSAISLLKVWRLDAATRFVSGGLALIVLITVAAFIYLGSFNFTGHPFQSIYIGVYLLALALALYFLWKERAHWNIQSVNG